MRVRYTGVCALALVMTLLGVSPAVSKIGDAKKLADGESVTLTDKILYLHAGFTGYIEEPDRTSGIRVEGLSDSCDYQDLTVDSLSGTMQTTPQGERYISLDTLSTAGSGYVGPLGANNAALSSDLLTGLKVRVWGVVKSIDYIHTCYVISDGAKGSGGIKVFGQCPGVVGSYVIVAGAAAFEGERVIYAWPDSPVPVAPPSGPLVIRWDPKLYNHGQNVCELQVIRDQDAGDVSAIPIRAIRDMAQWNAGFTDLSNLYGNGPFTVTYYQMPLGSTTPTSAMCSYTDEVYGITHQYQLRALRRTQTGVDDQGVPIYSYQFTKFGNYIIATAVQPVAAAFIVAPLNGDTLYVTQLCTGEANFRWQPTVGGDQYRVRVWPVQPGTGPTWSSSVIYYGSGTEMALLDADRLSLASVLSDPVLEDKEMYWRVDARHSGDTSSDWVLGDRVVFRIGSTPPGPP